MATDLPTNTADGNWVFYSDLVDHHLDDVCTQTPEVTE